LQDRILKRMSISALFTVFAAICGILEGFLPLQFILPVPGVKLGIANIFVVFAYRYLGARWALSVTIARTLIVFIFSGNSISFMLSLFGAVMSFVSLAFMMRFYNKTFSYIGISAVSAVFHGAGQLVCAYIIIGKAIIYYLPIMLIACALTGVFTGTLMNISDRKVSTFLSKV